MSAAAVTTEFQFKTIEGFLGLDEATANLVHVAQCMQRTHTLEETSNKDMMRRLFEMRKASVNALMDLIEQYIDQMPE